MPAEVPLAGRLSGRLRPLAVRLPVSYRDDPKALEKILIPTASGQRLPLTRLAHLEEIDVDVATGTYRRLSGYALDLSRDGLFALVQSGGVEPPQTIASVRLADGRRRVLARGDVAFPSWNR